MADYLGGEASHVQASACLACGHRLDAATVVNEDGTTVRPEPGDFTVCIACGYLMVFDDELRLRELTGEEMKQIAGDKRILAIQRAREKLPIKTYTGNTWGRVTTVPLFPGFLWGNGNER